jgi:hypothetical protein
VRRPVSTTTTLAVPLRTDAPRNTTFVRRASGASAGTTPGCFSTGERLAGHARLADEEVARLEDPSVAGIRLPAESTRTSPGHERVGVHRAFDAVADDATGEREALLQLLDRGGGAVLLIEAEQRGTDHDREDDPCVHPLERLSETAAAKIRIRTRGLPTCRQSRRSGPRRCASSTLFGPTTASRSAARAP